MGRAIPSECWALPSDLGYELLGEVGRGGMGVVYKARHRALDKYVAIKLLLPGMSVDRFYREARILAQLDSPNVVKVHDFDVLGGDSPVLVMEWVEGSDLARFGQERGGKIDEVEALPLMAQVAQGLAQAARSGIVHRDVKPSNILVDPRGASGSPISDWPVDPTGWEWLR